MTYRSHMNPQKRKTTGKYKVAEDHFCRGVKKSTPSLSVKGEKREKEEEEGLNFSEKLQVPVPTGPVLHLQVG